MEIKTAVSLLQEHCVKDGFVPCYSLILNNTGTHDTSFKWEVTVNGKSAVGTGRSKKEAKQHAAKLLLLKLKGEELWKEEIPIFSPYVGDYNNNAIGAVHEFCNKHKLTFPIYKIIHHEGAAHSKTFGVQCAVSSFSTEAEGRTVKEAKQRASHLMILKLQNCIKDGIFNFSWNCANTETAIEASSETAMNKDHQISSNTSDCNPIMVSSIADSNVKTPVSVLQEYYYKQGFAPCYNLIFDGNGSHDPTFHFEVTVEGNSAVGKGRSKKEAKHNAAKLLLLKLKGEEICKDFISPHDNCLDSSNNSIGILHEFCGQEGIAFPIYKIIREEGMPHAKTFEVRCTLLSYSTEAEGHTIKMAKHQASKLMLLKLQNYNKDENLSVDIAKKDIIAKACNATKDAFEKVLHKRATMNKYNSSKSLGSLLYNYSDYIKKNVLPFSNTLHAISHTDDVFLETHSNPSDMLISIMSQLECNFCFSFLNSKSKDDYLCNLQINMLNNANFIAVGKCEDDAKNNAVIKVLKFMVIMSKE